MLNFKALYRGLDGVNNCFVSLLPPFGSPAEAERRTVVRVLFQYLGRDSYIEFNEKKKIEEKDKNVSTTNCLWVLQCVPNNLS